MTTAEPVYRAWISTGAYSMGLRSLCTECAAKLHYQEWRPPLTCDHCGCPVILNGRRPQPTVVACGKACQIGVYNKRARARRKVTNAQVTCAAASCGKPFTPKRTDALYCSSACRQSAYRDRTEARAAAWDEDEDE
jgi:hypothetical protein